MKKHLLYKNGIACLAALLCAVLLWQLPAAAAEASLHYGKGTDGDQAMTATQLFEALYGSTEAPLNDAERQALDALSGVLLQYNNSVPPQLVDRTYNGETGTLTVRAGSYTYTAQNGKDVVWLPVSVSLEGGEPRPFSAEPNESGEYTCLFENLWHSDELRVDVTYAWQVEIPVETADGLLILPYTLGSDALEQLLAYESAKHTYDTQRNAYDTYVREQQAYEIAAREFAEYNTALAAYTTQKTAYDLYVIQKAKYDADLKAYREYKEKQDAYDAQEAAFYYYEQKRQEYASLYDRYEPYLQGVTAMQARLVIMESMFLYAGPGWQFYSGVMGGTVDSVIANRHKLETVALVPRAVIENAKSSTDALRPLLKGYSDLRATGYANELEKQKALFAYYAEHYEEIRDAVALLYDSVYKIYSNSAVVTAMSTDAEASEKQPHFRQFLAQLYILYCALDPQAAPDPAWLLSPYDKRTYQSLLEEQLLLPVDVNPSPAGVSMPEVEIVLPDDLPEPVEKPVKDFTEVEDPSVKGAPTPVANPGNPPAVKTDPGDPPAEVSPPTVEEPTPPVLSEQVRALAEALRAGELPQRQARGTSQLLTLQETVTKAFSIDNRKTVSFYDHNGELIQTVLVEYGESVTAPNADRAPDEVYSSHIFLGWLRFGDTDLADRVTLQSVTSDLSLVPKYESQKRIYEVTWVVNGVQKTTTHYWGELPECPIGTDRSDAQYTYTFAGWSPALTPVQGNVTYTVQYTTALREYTVTWHIGNRTVQEQYLYGQMPICTAATDRTVDDRIYTFVGWDRVVRSVTGDASYTAQYKGTPLATYNDGTACRIEHTQELLILHATQSTVNFSLASSYARGQGKALLIKWGNMELPLSAGDLAAYENAKCTKLELAQSAGTYEGCVAFAVRHLNDRGIAVSTGLTNQITVYDTPRTGKYAMVYRSSGKEWKPIEIERYDDGRAVFRVSAGDAMEYRSEYRMTFTDPNEKCNLTAFPKHAPVGSQIALNANCEYGYEISSAVLTYADGRTEVIREKFFLMTADIVGVEVNVTPITYHITFVVEGEVISEQMLLFGEKVTVPADPTKAEDALYTYTFAGWTPYVVGATTGEERNPVFTASFDRIAKTSVIDSQAPVKDRFLTVMVPLACGALLLLVAAIVLVILLLRRKKRKKLAAPAETTAQMPEAEPEATAEAEGFEAESTEVQDGSTEAEFDRPDAEA